MRKRAKVAGLAVTIPKRAQLPARLPPKPKKVICYHELDILAGVCAKCGMVRWENQWFTPEEMSEEYVNKKMAEYRANPTPVITYRGKYDFGIHRGSTGRLTFLAKREQKHPSPGWHDQYHDHH